MTNWATGKGALLTAGIAFLSMGSTLAAGGKLWEGLAMAVAGAGFIFLREWIKEA